MYQFMSSAAVAAIAFFVAANPPQPVKAQTPPIRAYQPKATTSARDAQILDQQQKSNPSRFDLQKYPLTESNAAHWQESLWAIGVLAPEKDYALQALENVLQMTTAANLTDPQKGIIDTAIQVATQLYTLKPTVYGKLKQHFLRTIDYSTDPQWVAISLAAIAKSAGYPSANISQIQIDKLSLKVQQRFPNWEQDLHLLTTIKNIQSDRQLAKKIPIPNLTDLLKWQIAPQQAHMYVLCRPNRDILCLAVLKDRQGQFVRQNKQFWSAPLLLQSIHNLDWNFSNGRTPQGIYRMEGLTRQPDDEVFHAYGQFALVNLFLPFEDGVNAFLPQQKGKFTGDLQVYQTLLPPTWRNYEPIQQAYLAGTMGRSLFRIHGSGAAIDFFRNKPAVVNTKNFDWNATLGCLSALEIYDDRGSLVKADMPKILNALNTVGKSKIDGFLIVVDVPSPSNEPVTIAEVAKYLAPSALRSNPN
ncbi:hypothetical protein APA_3384 [Pseudanabaena sp. lw0831]|nr:hypothetical protein APA_3384 [Pseudanabaena sp. lw0831]